MRIDRRIAWRIHVRVRGLIVKMWRIIWLVAVSWRRVVVHVLVISRPSTCIDIWWSGVIISARRRIVRIRNIIAIVGLTV
jgi:hypothetical protein